MADPPAPPTLENPRAWVGILAGRDDVALVLNPGTPQEQRICFGPMVALAIAAELGKYAQKLLAAQSAAIARHEANTRPSVLRDVRKFDA
jgi:hypothetical protein